MATRTSQKGFSVIEIVIGLAVVGLVAVLGYTVHDRLTGTPATETTQPQSVSKEGLKAPEIQSAADLSEATEVLDGAELDADSAALDKELAEF